MKVRISGNKIRFRLKEPEVKEFQQKGTVSEMLEFGSDEKDQLKFTLAENELDEINIRFVQNETTVSVPKTKADLWTSTELVGFEAEVDTGKGKTVSILVEKDFMCMDGREEENVGSYPNPLANL
ncbi:DUF7009 family protein [Segetibacter aerophilus]|uniref:Uncharacterized protein n=1 Tax=Segetibacter aerophilus TaxID=670293 RepID=A0A512BAG3_9BACT|nr:hypothetical protein [Segetibacter aerophilus]GEO08827.1 hypothetical protein SAE01_13230 [Segetibacter aerophilus]